MHVFLDCRASVWCYDIKVKNYWLVSIHMLIVCNLYPHHRSALIRAAMPLRVSWPLVQSVLQVPAVTSPPASFNHTACRVEPSLDSATLPSSVRVIPRTAPSTRSSETAVRATGAATTATMALVRPSIHSVISTSVSTHVVHVSRLGIHQMSFINCTLCRTIIMYAFSRVSNWDP